MRSQKQDAQKGCGPHARGCEQERLIYEVTASMYFMFSVMRTFGTHSVNQGKANELTTTRAASARQNQVRASSERCGCVKKSKRHRANQLPCQNCSFQRTRLLQRSDTSHAHVFRAFSVYGLLFCACECISRAQMQNLSVRRRRRAVRLRDLHSHHACVVYVMHRDNQLVS